MFSLAEPVDGIIHLDHRVAPADLERRCAGELLNPSLRELECGGVRAAPAHFSKEKTAIQRR